MIRTIEMVLKTVVHDGVDLIHLAQDRCQWRDVVHKVIKFWVRWKAN